MQANTNEHPIFMEQNDNLLGVIATLFRWKKAILYTCGLAAVGSILISLLLPVYYEGSTEFYAASPDLAAPELIFGTTNEAMEYYGEDMDVDRILTIAKGNEMVEYMINKYKLYERYDIDTSNVKAPYYVKLAFADLYNIKQTKYDALKLSIEDEDPKLAATMANDARNKIDEIGRRLIKESQSKVLLTYEASIAEKTEYLNILNDSLQKVRKRYNVYNTITQSEGIANALGSANSRLALFKAELGALRPTLRRDSIRRREAFIAATEQQKINLEAQLDQFNKGMALADMLFRIQDETSEQLSEAQERYKQVQAAHNSYFPTIHVVETAQTPVIKSRPIRWLIVVGSVIIAFIFACIGVLIFDTYKEVNWQAIINGK